MFRIWRRLTVLKCLAVAIVATALLAMPVMSSPHRECSSPNSITVEKYQPGMVAAAVGCCTASHCCPVLSEPVALEVPAIAISALSSAVKLDQPLLLVRSLHPPPRALVV